MAKGRKTNAASQPQKRTRLWQGLLALIVVVGLVSAYVLISRGSGDSESADQKQVADLLSVSSLKGHLVLPAEPRNPRPETLDPNNFTDTETHAAYLAAKEVPEVLEHIACYCGCFKEAGHRNNLDCYHDNHGVT
jgi:hypothetical protein